MTRKNTFQAEGPDAMDDIRRMLSGYEPAGEAAAVTVEIEYADEPDESVTASAPAQPVDSKGEALPKLKTDTRIHRVLEVLEEAQEWLSNPELAERIGVEPRRVQSTTSDLHRAKELIAARRCSDDGAKFEYHINSRGEKMLERLGPTNSE